MTDPDDMDFTEWWEQVGSIIPSHRQLAVETVLWTLAHVVIKPMQRTRTRPLKERQRHD